MKNIKIALILLLLSSSFSYALDQTSVTDANTAITILKRGNATFASSQVTPAQQTAEARLASIKAQHPFAIILTCSDSRMTPEYIFQQNLNRIAVIRTAGNVIGNIGLGSIEYFVKNCGVRLIVVLGHQNCGAVKATIARELVSENMKSILNKIEPSVKKAKRENGNLLVNSIKNNAIRFATKIRHDIDFLDEKHEVKVIAAYYSMDTGKVDWLN